MAEAQQSGTVDLERELTCSICTDVLYQPLTLLDCLHTFCGACLKEWFSWQGTNSSELNPYTCPSCRASVRGTKPNATVTTLLEMFLQANPGRGKSQEEKEEMSKHYKPGTSVLPRIRRQQDPEDDEDRRLLEEVREMSLREVGVTGGTLETPRDGGRSERSRERRSGDSRHRRPYDPSNRSPGGTYLNYRSDGPGRDQEPSRNIAQTRRLEHQASLRSLLSASDLDSQEMEEEIMRQIMEEGLLDGIDLNNIDVSQEDEISERIAQAYRRRQRQRQEERERGRQARESRNNENTQPSQPARQEEQSRRRHHVRSGSGANQPSTSSRPPVSRPHLFDAADAERRHHRRSSSQGSARPSSRGQTSATTSAGANSSATRSVTDLSSNTRPDREGHARPRRLSQNDRRATDPERMQNAERSHRNTVRHASNSNPNSPSVAALPIIAGTSSSVEATSPRPATAGTARRPTTSPAQRPAAAYNQSTPSLVTADALPNVPIANTRPTSSSAAAPAAVRPPTFPEPSISCDRCGQSHIEYDLHYSCLKCNEGKYNLCLRCYRLGKGCLHWYGFGHAAWPRYERQAPVGGYPPGHEHPHILVGRRYLRPRTEPIRTSPNDPERRVTSEDPAERLQSGVFCEICLAFANTCYWRCDSCNEGAWGFCNTCVNRGRHCTHPLLPLTHKVSPSRSAKVQRSDGTSVDQNASTSPAEAASHTNTPSITPKSASLIRGPGTVALANRLFRPLTFSTRCDICTYPIPPSHTRFHCPRCADGDYDICAPCYHALVAAGRITSENGHQGWRRCLRGHRMVVVGFEDRDGGQRRVVTRDLVGGLALKDEDGADSQAAVTTGSNADVGVTPNWSWKDADGTVRKARAVHQGSSAVMSPAGGRPSGRFPPDGGVGARVLALWGYYPADGVEDELMFPKGAEIREAEDINGDWFWGCYAGAKGLFPGNYGRIVA